MTLLVGSFDPYKPDRDMTYDVFGGTLNPIQTANGVGNYVHFVLKIHNNRWNPIVHLLD